MLGNWDFMIAFWLYFTNVFALITLWRLRIWHSSQSIRASFKLVLSSDWINSLTCEDAPWGLLLFTFTFLLKVQWFSLQIVSTFMYFIVAWGLVIDRLFIFSLVGHGAKRNAVLLHMALLIGLIVVFCKLSRGLSVIIAFVLNHYIKSIFIAA